MISFTASNISSVCEMSLAKATDILFLLLTCTNFLPKILKTPRIQAYFELFLFEQNIKIKFSYLSSLYTYVIFYIIKIIQKNYMKK